MDYKKLFTPFSIGGVTVKNRIVMAPVMMGFCGFDGTPTEEMMNYYEERAKGGTGLIMTEIARVDDKTGAGAFNQPAVSRDYHIQPLSRLAERIHAHGAKLFVQLHHPGRQNLGLLIGTIPLCVTLDRLTKKYKKLLFKLAPKAGKFLIEHKIVPAAACPSKVEPSYFSGGRVRALRHGEIKRLIEEFITAAERAQKAGVDGVVLHAAHGYLLQQFLSPHTNRRLDEYGGSFENRMRFPIEILKGIKERCPGFPVIVRLTVDEYYAKIGRPGIGYTVADGVKMAKGFEEAGADAIDVSCGAYDTFNYWLEPASFPAGWRTEMIAAVRNAVKIPVIAVNIIRTPKDAESQLEGSGVYAFGDEHESDGEKRGLTDLVSMGRPHIADPEFVSKALSGREREIKRCISCLYCFESMQNNAYHGKHAACSVNPFIGREKVPLQKDGNGRRIAVVGAGPAGLTAVEILAKRGFKVRVYEKEARAGGQVALAASEQFKKPIGWCIEDLEYSARLNGAELLYGVKAAKALIEEYDPYAVIIASGGLPIVPKSIPGIDKPHVYTAPDVFKRKVVFSNENIAVIGSGMTGLDVSLLLSSGKNKVTVIEMAKTPAPNMWMQHPDDALPKLKAENVDIKTCKKLLKINDGSIIVQDVKTLAEEEIQAENVVLAMGVRPDAPLYSELKDKYKDKIYLVGDAAKSGRIADATRAAFEAAISL